MWNHLVHTQYVSYTHEIHVKQSSLLWFYTYSFLEPTEFYRHSKYPQTCSVHPNFSFKMIHQRHPYCRGRPLTTMKIFLSHSTGKSQLPSFFKPRILSLLILLNKQRFGYLALSRWWMDVAFINQLNIDLRVYKSQLMSISSS